MRSSKRDTLPFLTRRGFMGKSLAFTVAWMLPATARRAYAGDDGLDSAIETSQLVYVSPLRSDGQESTCHGEVWFVSLSGDLFVVTDHTRWRAAAIGKGLDRARLWVGEHGVWQRSKGAFKQSPTTVATARLERDPKMHERALEAFGAKYEAGWDSWGPRFRAGLASGERVLIRYSPMS